MNYKGEGKTQFEAQLNFSKLEVTVSNDEQFYIITDKEHRFSVEETENSILLKQKKNSFFYKLFHWIPFKLDVRIPKSFNGSLQINNRDGKTVIYKLNIENLDLENRNGRIEYNDVISRASKIECKNGKIVLNNADSDMLSITSNNGKIVMDNVKAENELTAKSSNGKIILRNSSIKSVDLHSSNGRIELESVNAEQFELSSSNGKITGLLNGQETEYSMNISTVNGAVYIAGKKFHGGYIYKDKDKKKHIKANSKNGSIKFIFSNTNS